MPLFTKPQFNSVWASTGTKLSPIPAKISQGWIVEIPPYEYDNWLQGRQDQLLAHINQVGIPMWDATVEYQAGKSYIQGTTTGVVYRAVTTNTNVNPELDIQGNWVTAFDPSGACLLKSQNLADVPDKALARQNLGIATTEFYDGRYLVKSQNLADVPNKATARNNLGLGSSATMNVGAGYGTVAAGDDSRIVNAASKYNQVVANGGLIGGGLIGDNPGLSIGTPSSLSRTSGNSVSDTTHSHFINMPSFFPLATFPNNTFAYEMPGGFLIQGGVTPSNVPRDGYVDIVLPRPYTKAFVVMASLYDAYYQGTDGNAVGAQWVNSSTIRIFNTSVDFSPKVMWNTYGVL